MRNVAVLAKQTLVLNSLWAVITTHTIYQGIYKVYTRYTERIEETIEYESLTPIERHCAVLRSLLRDTHLPVRELIKIKSINRRFYIQRSVGRFFAKFQNQSRNVATSEATRNSEKTGCDERERLIDLPHTNACEKASQGPLPLSASP